jgi:hypothetical protein
MMAKDDLPETVADVGGQKLETGLAPLVTIALDDAVDSAR